MTDSEWRKARHKLISGRMAAAVACRQGNRGRHPPRWLLGSVRAVESFHDPGDGWRAAELWRAAADVATWRLVGRRDHDGTWPGATNDAMRGSIGR